MRARIRAIWTHLRTDNSEPERLAASVFWGIFLGILPLYGIQTVICYAASRALRLNFLTVFAVSNVSNPLFVPFIMAGGIAIGEFVRFGRVAMPDLDRAQAMQGDLFGEVGDVVVSLLVGDFILGVLVGLICAGAAFKLASWRKAKRAQQAQAELVELS